MNNEDKHNEPIEVKATYEDLDRWLTQCEQEIKRLEDKIASLEDNNQENGWVLPAK